MGFFLASFSLHRTKYFARDRNTDTTGGGVLIALRSDLVAQGEDLHPPGADCEMLWTSLHVTGRPTLYIGAFYRKHHNSFNSKPKAAFRSRNCYCRVTNKQPNFSSRGL